MKRRLLILTCALLAFSSRIFAQVDCTTIPQEEILHCEISNDGSITLLSLQRGSNYHCYREPRIVITRSNNAQEVFLVSASNWQYTPNNQNVTTTFTNATGTFTFTMNSTAAFSPLSGYIGNKQTTFRTCGVQRTSAYYWTKSSQNKLEAFTCPPPKSPSWMPKGGIQPLGLVIRARRRSGRSTADRPAWLY